MKIKNFYNLKIIDNDNDIGILENFIASNSQHIDFYNYDALKKNNKVLINTHLTENDGYRGYWVYSIQYENELIALLVSSGRDGRDSRNTYITNAKLFKEMIIYLEELTNEDLELYQYSINEDVSSLDYIYGNDMSEKILNLNYKFNINIGDIIIFDTTFINEDNEKQIFRDIKGKITNINPKSSIRTITVEVLSHRLITNYSLKNRHNTFNYLLNLYDVPKPPSEWNDYSDKQKEKFKDLIYNTNNKFGKFTSTYLNFFESKKFIVN